MIKNLFDCVYCINLDKRSDRWLRCLQQFERYDFTAKRFSGVEYKNKNLNKIICGRIGCWLSFYGVLVESYLKNHKSVLILEDDFKIIDPPNQFNEKIKNCYDELPENWDLFYLSAYYVKGYDFEPVEKFSNNLIKAKTAFCCHCIAISEKGIKNLLALMPEISCEKNAIDLIKEYDGLDWFLVREAQQILNCYGAKRLLISQYPSFSDIENTHVDGSYHYNKSYSSIDLLESNENFK